MPTFEFYNDANTQHTLYTLYGWSSQFKDACALTCDAKKKKTESVAALTSFGLGGKRFMV